MVQLSSLDTQRMAALEQAAVKAQALHLAEQVIQQLRLDKSVLSQDLQVGALLHPDQGSADET